MQGSIRNANARRRLIAASDQRSGTTIIHSLSLALPPIFTTKAPPEFAMSHPLSVLPGPTAKLQSQNRGEKYENTREKKVDAAREKT